MPNTQCKKCKHGYIAEMCAKDHPSQIIPCKDVPNCPVIPVAEDEKRYPVMLTRDEMRMVRAAMAGMPTLPIAESVSKAMDVGETAATIARAVAYGDILTAGRSRAGQGPGDVSSRIED